MFLETYRDLSDPLSSWDISLWSLALALLFFLALFTFYRIRSKTEQENKDIPKLQRSNAITWAYAFIFYGMSILLCLIWKYMLQTDTIAFLIVDSLVVLFVTFAVFIKIVQTEISVNQYGFYKKRPFTIFTFAFLVFTAIFTPSVIRASNILTIVYIVLMVIAVAVFPGIFLYIAIKLEGKNRQKALKIVVAAIILLVGLIFQPQNIQMFSYLENFNTISNTFLILCPIFVSIAIIIMFDNYRAIL